MRAVIVHWVDINTSSGWKDREEHLELAKCISIGYVKEETEELIELFGDLGRDDEKEEDNRGITIPKGCITKIREIPPSALSPLGGLGDGPRGGAEDGP